MTELIIGVIFLVFGFIGLKTLKKVDNPIVSKSPYLFILIGIFGTLSGAFFYAEAGTAYAVQYPWGGDKLIKSQGVKAKWWGRTIPMSYEISVKFVRPDAEGNIPESSNGIINLPARSYAFADAIKAKIELSTIVRLNIDDAETFLDMADKNRSESKLVYGRIIPNIEQSIKNTCKLMDAQDYISGFSAEFDRYFQDQLNNGAYRVEPYYEKKESAEVIGDTTTVRTVGNTNSNQKKFRIVERNGEPVRDMSNTNSLTEYGLSFSQAHVTSIDWEPKFDTRLDLQKEQVAQTQLEKQQAEREFYRAKKEIARGESEKAAERARLEKTQIQKTIEAETRAKVAEQDLIAEKKRYEVELFKSKSKKVAADAQAYENQKLVNAGLTPQERAEYDLRTIDVLSANLSKMQVPGNILVGGGKDGNPTEALLQVKLLQDLLKK